jgi:transcriptional regulator with XRE-family HTH domain
VDEDTSLDGVLKDRVRQLRVSKGLSQDSLAKQIGITQAALSLIERGGTRTLRAETLARLAQVLGEDPEYIRTGRRSKTPQGGSIAALEGIYNRLDAAGRKMWLEMGELLLRQAQSLHNPHRESGHSERIDPDKDRLAREILSQLSAIVSEHGPDALAGALDYLSAQAPDGSQSRRKAKT